MRKIILLWPTVRPQIMRETYINWMTNSTTDPSEYPIETHIAVNTEEQKNQLTPWFRNITVIGENQRGPCWATYCLTKDLNCEENPILVLVSDDFFPPRGWDEYLQKEFKDYDGAIHVNDGYMHTCVMTIPIMTYNCLQKLNRIIYHPAYKWQYSDSELYYNLLGLGLVKEVMSPDVIFMHKHYSHGYRAQDENDVYGNNMSSIDAETFKHRMKLPVADRLRV